MNKKKNNELYHYGVKGMKWGVRRFQPYSTGEPRSKKNKDENANKFNEDDDIIIKKGTKAYRISANKEDTGQYRYLTVDQNDRNFYKGMWPDVLKNITGAYNKNTKIYEQKYKLKEDLISPSAIKRQQIASELGKSKEAKFEIFYAREVERIYNRSKQNNDGFTIKDVKAFIDASLSGNTGGSKEYSADFRKYLKEHSKTIDKMSPEKRAIYTLGAMGNSDRLKVMYGQKIAESGYNMVIDDHGTDFAGNRQRVNAPIIVLKANEALKQIGSKKVSDFDSHNAMNKYQKDVATIPGKMSERNFVPNIIKKYYGTKNYYDNPTLDYIYDNNNNLVDY